MFHFFDMLFFTLERLWQHRVLVLWVLLGLAAATTLAVSLVLYVDAVNTTLLTTRLQNPPYAFVFRYLGSWNGNIGQDDTTSANAAVENKFPEILGLPVARDVRFTRSLPWSVRPAAESGGRNALGSYNLGVLQGAELQMRIVAGDWPPAEDTAGDDGIPVLLAETMLYTTGLEVGDELAAAMPGGDPVRLVIAALWQPVNAADPSWIFPPKYFDEIFLVREADFRRALAGQERPIEETGWQLIFDGSELRTSDVTSLLGRVIDGERLVTAVLPGIRLTSSPVQGLTLFTQDVSQLTQQLVIVILPVGGLVLYFVTLVAGLLVSRQQTEDLVLQSRGMSRRGLLGIHSLMWLILAGLSLAAGLAFAPVVVQLVGQTSSFLRFDGSAAALTITYTSQAVALGGVTALLAASTGLVLAWRSTGQTVNSFRQRSARASTAWWQRMYLDVLLLIPAAYVYYTLLRQGGLVAAADDPFADPLTFIGPTLFALGLTLAFLRLWPALIRTGARLTAYSRSVALLMALRELTRSIGRYRGILLMMCFTLSLTGVTASMASTIDQSLEDSINYRIGADAVLITAAETQAEQNAPDETTGQTTFTVTGYNTAPAADLLAVDGISQVSRVGHYPARLVLRSRRVDGVVMGTDRATIAAVARFRRDYADEPAADLFNRLAGNRTGILLNRQAAVDNNLLIGQEITFEVSVLGEWYQTTAPIVGLLDYFPTLNPKDGFFIITNLDPIFELVGTELPHDVWLSLRPQASPDGLLQRVREMNFPVLEWRDPKAALAAARADPSRRGVLGFLSVGFVASILLTLVGAIIQNTVSFRAQSSQLGSLRAMGLSGGSVGAYLILLQGIAASSGILGGTSIGVLTTLLFLPLLDFSGGLPPYLVRVAWDEIALVYTAFAAVLFFVTLFMTVLMSREQLTTIVKLGDA